MKAIVSSPKKLIVPLCLLAAAILPAVLGLSASHMSILIVAVLYMYWTSAWNLMGGYAGLFSLGNGIYIGLGAYITAVLYVYYGISPFAGIMIAGLLTGGFSALIGYPTFKIKGIYYSLATFALLLVLKIVFTTQKSIFGLYLGGSDGFKIPLGNLMAKNMQFAEKLPYYYIVLALLVIILVVSNYISQNKIGYYFRAINANTDAAASLGISVVSQKIKAQFLSAFFTAVGGGFYCMLISYIDPSTVFGADMSINILIMCIVGGANTLWGPVIGAGLLYIINRIAAIYFASRVVGMATIIFGATLMIVIFFIPGGLLGWLKGIFYSRKNAKARTVAAMEGGDGNE